MKPVPEVLVASSYLESFKAKIRMESFKELCQVLESSREKNRRPGFTESLNFFIFDKLKSKKSHIIYGKIYIYIYNLCSEYYFLLHWQVVQYSETCPKSD